MNSPNQQSIKFDDPKPLVQLDLKKLWKKALRNWYYVVVCLIIGLVSSYIYLRYSYPSYSVQARIITSSTEEQELNLAFFREQKMGEIQGKLIDEIELLQSRNLISNVVRDLELNVVYRSVGRVKDLDIYPYSASSPVLVSDYEINPDAYGRILEVEIMDDGGFVIRYLDEEIKGYPSKSVVGGFGSLVLEINHDNYTSFNEIIIQFNNVESTIDAYQGTFSARKVSGSSNVIDLNIVQENAAKGEAFLSTLIEYYDELIVSDKRRIADYTEVFLNQRLIDLEIELNDSEEEMIQFILDNELLINDLEDKTSMLRNYFTELRLKKETLQHQQALVEEVSDLFSTTQDLNTNQVGYLLAQTDGLQHLISYFDDYQELVLEERKLRQSVAPGYPGLNTLEAEIDSLENFMLKSVTRGERMIDSGLQLISRSEDSLYLELVRIPELRIPATKKERILTVKEELYLYLLQQKEQIKLSQATTVSETKILMNPRTTQVLTTSPVRAYSYGVFLSLAIPLGFMSLIIIANTRIESPDDVKNRTDVPIMGSIGHSRSIEHIVVTKDARTGMAEMFRLLRSNLSFFLSGTGQQVKDKMAILVTSSISGDGKTFVVVNMGLSIALTGKKVCLVNIDLRKPKLAKYLGQDDTKIGLSNYLSGTGKIQDVVLRLEDYDNLDYIPSGPIPPNPSELLLTERMEEAINELKSIYDVVIFDAPPIGLVADAYALSKYVHLSIYIVRYRHSHIDSLDLIQNAKDQQKLKNPAIILNDAKVHQNSYGYGYGYGYGYYQENKGGWWSRIKKTINRN